MNAQLPDLNMDPNHLYREEVLTDQRIGTIRQLIPVSPDGGADTSRTTVFVGSAQMMTPAGALPLSFVLEVTSLAAAVAGFGEAAAAALEKTMEELQEMQRQAASSIVVPGQPGSMGGGIQMP